MLERNNETSISVGTGTMVRAVLVALGVFLIFFLRNLVMVVLTAVAISAFVESAVPHLRKIKINRVFGIIILYILSILIFAALFYLFAPLLITEVYNFSSFLSSYIPNNSILNFFQNNAFSGAKDIVANLPSNLSFASLLSVSKAFVLNLSGGFFETLAAAFGSIFNVVLIVLISFYISIEEGSVAGFLRIILPSRYEDYGVDLWERVRRKIALWVKGQILLGLLITVLIYLLLSLFGIKYALLLAIIAGVMELVPYGILVALIPAVSFSYLSGGIESALMVAGAYLIIHEFEVFLLAPLVIKKVVGLSPIVIILAAIIGFELAGLWGMLLAIPTSVFLVEFANDIEGHKIIAQTPK